MAKFEIRGIKNEAAFTVCCDGEPILGATGDPAFMFSHDGTREGRRAAYAAAKEVVNKLNKSAAIVSSVARSVNRASQSN